MRIEVKSSNILSVDYNEKKETLIIEFIGRNKYLYTGVGNDLYNEFINSESLGKFFHARIRGKFSDTKIIEEKGND